MLALGSQGIALLDAEAVLLVDDHQREVGEVDPVLEQRVRPDDDPGLAGEMQITVELGASIVGTELRIVQAGIPDVIPVDYCYQGWQESLELLAKLVEPEIPDGA